MQVVTAIVCGQQNQEIINQIVAALPMVVALYRVTTLKNHM
ncbi:hypothetical protein AB97_3571 [Escherichia coli 1-110-08_S3_C1]|nr:hypothetical protein AC55_3563 [Escherichia coli 1-110-08_S3_C3]EYE19725.1 hypothetical protein AC25_3519 [Escherichia coli 1-110-08_S3_C2]EYE22644.1 hypothetical protein AB97_3571 [Escherichia coli 1-110-08_S3_C1]